MKCFAIASLLLCAVAIPFQSIVAKGIKPLSQSDKQRLTVTTDLGGTDPDDTQSMIHLLVCSDRIDIEGIISSQVWMDDPDKSDKIREVLSWYEDVRPNLACHSAGFPDADYLKSVTVTGQKHSNMSGVGDYMDSPGSELIISTVDNEEDGRPVWIAAWGGMNTVAQALYKVKNTRSEEELSRFINKIRIYDVLGQDDAGAWIAKNFPNLKYIRNVEVYGWGPSDEWTRENVQNRGSLGSHYPNRIWATEGDSPSFFYVYANGLNVPEHVDYGGWGGRFDIKKQRNIRGMSFIEKSGKNEKQYDDYYMTGSSPEGCNAINRWRGHIWNNFAARMLWSTTADFSTVNHHPVAVVNGDKSLKCMYRTVKAGDDVKLDAQKSEDPDGDSISYKWSIYSEPGTYRGNVTIHGETQPVCKIEVPRDASGKNFHVILEVNDNGIPALTAYRRILFEVE